MDITLKTITPVHIGDGDKLYALDYVIHNNTYYRVSQRDFLKFLASSNDKKLISKYSEWIHDTQKEITDLEEARKRNNKNSSQRRDYNQQLQALRGKFNLMSFANENNKRQEFVNFIKKQCKIKIKFNNSALSGEVASALKTGNNEAYLPATSIKGSVRTALLYSAISKIEHNRFSSLIQNYFNQVKREKSSGVKKMQKMDNAMDQHFFYCGIEYKNQQGQTRIKDNDEKFDLMKLVSFSDGISKEKEQCLGLGKVDLYIVQRNKENATKANRQRQTPYVEYIKEEVCFSSKMNFNIDFLYAIKSEIIEGENTSFIEIKEKKQWIDIKRKVKNLFNLDISSLDENNKEEKRQEVLNYILSCVYKFSDAQLDADKIWFKNFKSNDRIGEFYHKIEGNLEVINEKKIRLGYATGFSGMTELLYFKNNEQLKAVFQEIMEEFKIGNNPRNRGTYNPNIMKFPKSRRLISIGEEIKPLGWLTFTDKLEENNGQGKPKNIIEASQSLEPNYYTGKLKQRATGIEAVVIKSGKPNRVKLYINKDNMPELELTGYRSELKVGSVVIVQINQITKKKVIKEAGFVKFKTS